jgi:hypothetical protein
MVLLKKKKNNLSKTTKGKDLVSWNYKLRHKSPEWITGQLKPATLKQVLSVWEMMINFVW